MLYQPPELWAYQAVVCEHDGRYLKTYRMECNKRTTPIVALIEEAGYETVVVPEEDEDEAVKEDAFRVADERFLGILEKLCEGRIVSSQGCGLQPFGEIRHFRGGQDPYLSGGR